MNDSVLVQSYIEAYDLSYPEALRRIDREVKELKQELQNQGSFTMDNLGLLTVNKDGNYEFTPCEAGVLSPTLYGLADFSFNYLEGVEAIAPADSVQQTAEEKPVAKEVPLSPTLLDYAEDSHEDSALTIKMSWVRNTVAVAVAVLAFFLISSPIANSNLSSQAISHLQQHLLFKLIPQDTNKIPAEPINIPAQVAATPAKATTAAPATERTVGETPAPQASAEVAHKTSYCVVLASQVKKENAENFVSQLKKQGYSQARILEQGHVRRVIYGSYATEGEAYQQLKKMNRKAEFADAWVYQLKAQV